MSIVGSFQKELFVMGAAMEGGYDWSLSRAKLFRAIAIWR